MLEFGNKNRTQHPTDANAESSRSHAVFQVMQWVIMPFMIWSRMYILSLKPFILLIAQESLTIVSLQHLKITGKLDL